MTNDDAPGLPSIWDEAKDHIDQGDHDKAAEIYDYILLIYGDNDAAVEFANAYLGDLYLTTRRLDLAERHLKKAIRYAPKKPDYRYLLGFTYSVKEGWLGAIRELKKALKLDPDNAEYERCLGWAMFNGGNRKDGLLHLCRALELSPSHTNALTDLATAMMMLGNIEKAREYGERAVEADPGNVLAHKLLEQVDRIERIQKRRDQPSASQEM